MKSVIVHADGRRIDLASGITPEAYAELEATQGQGTQRKPLLFCGGCNGGVYIKHGHVQRDELFAAHYQRGDCLETLAITAASDDDEDDADPWHSDGGDRVAATPDGTPYPVERDGEAF